MKRVLFTQAAQELLTKLQVMHGPLMFHQSGGCCDGSAPMCFPRNEFKVGQSDVFLGWVGDESANAPFYISGPQFEYWKHTELTVDVVPGRGSGFSVEAPEGVRFLIRSRVFTDDEWAELQTQPILTGTQHS
ncbi:MAG: hypothetical protein RLZZ426_394 [Actinomycetota bacterium]|jgi:hypothetical protein